MVEYIRQLDNDKSEITISVKEKKADGTERKLHSSELKNGLSNQVSI